MPSIQGPSRCASPLSKAAEAIAICGMAFRLPGGITTDEKFWDLLVNGKDMRTRIPESRFNIHAFNCIRDRTDTIKTQHGYFLQDDFATLDTTFFSVSKAELEAMDPQQRLLLEVTRECLEDAGEIDWRGQSVGCFVGTFGEDWLDVSTRDAQDPKTKNPSGYDDFATSNRISYQFDFRGPSVTIRTACSSSLVALHQACQALVTHDCESAIVAGVNVILSPTMTIAMSQQGLLSPDGSCKTFDARANGYARGEAVNCIYIKSFSAALRDGNPVRAVIRGTGVNFDGKTASVSTPSSNAQEALMRQVYEKAGLRFADTAFVEAHGTGTPVGDPIEANAIAACFSNGIHIGSVKPNLGHSEGASGLTSLIKAVLALERKTIPPNIKFVTPNPAIDFQKLGLQVPVEPKPWPQHRNHRVSINSFGIGGANAHVVLDAAFADEPYNSSDTQTPHLLLFSAHDDVSLQRVAEQNEEYVQRNPDNLENLAYTLALRRDHLPYKGFAVFSGSRQVSSVKNEVKGHLKQPHIVMAFTGQGAQWPGMCAELLHQNMTFAATMQVLENHLKTIPHGPGWFLRNELLEPPESSRVHLAQYSQPLCTAVQLCLIDCLAAVDVRPNGVVGHSSGEIAAAYAAGAISKKDAISIAYYRGLVCGYLDKSGGMAAVGLSWDDINPYLKDGVVRACDNSPGSTTISGDADAVAETLVAVQSALPGTFWRRLHIDKAYHSHHMLEVGARYVSLLNQTLLVQDRVPAIPFFSSATNESTDLGPEYWRANLESPVLFKGATWKALDQFGDNIVFVEIGPHSVLKGPLQQTLAARGASLMYVPTLVRQKNSLEYFLSCVGDLFAFGLPVNLQDFFPQGKVLTGLPRYPWNRETRHWHESRISQGVRFRQFPPHDLLGSRLVETAEAFPIWRNLLSLDNVAWLRDHKIRNDIVMPSTAYIVMVTEAMRQMKTAYTNFQLRNTIIRKGLLLQDTCPVELVTALTPRRLTDHLQSNSWDFTVSGLAGDHWVQYCTGQVKAYVTVQQQSIQIERYARQVEPGRWYKVMRKAGLNYGPAFSLQRDITSHPSRSCATAAITNDMDEQFPVHPASIDQMLQILTVASTQGQAGRLSKLCLPSAFEEVWIKQAPLDMLLKAQTVSRPSGSLVGTVFATDFNGNLVASLRGVQLLPTNDDVSVGGCDPHAMAQMVWQPSIEFMPFEQLVQPLSSRRDGVSLVNRIVALILIELRPKLQPMHLQHIGGYLSKYLTWCAAKVEDLERGVFLMVHDGPELIAMDEGKRSALLQELIANALSWPTGPEVLGPILALREHADALLIGDMDPLGILFSNDLLVKAYDVMYNVNQDNLLKVLGHGNPAMRILEVGAGTGGATQYILSGLAEPERGITLYSSYTFTDISTGFFRAAKERFSTAPNMEYKSLDIAREPTSQGFEPASFDLIIATNVIHTTASLAESLRNVRGLLRHGGHLLLTELCPSSQWLDFIFGALPDWWNGLEDGRVGKPYVSLDRWKEELTNAGFCLDGYVYDDIDEARMNVHMLAKPRAVTHDTHLKPQVSLLVETIDSMMVRSTSSKLAEAGYSVSIYSLGESMKLLENPTDAIALLDDQHPFFTNMSERQFSIIQGLISSLGKAGKWLLWITKPCSINNNNPSYAQALGFARVIRSELIALIATLEIMDADLQQTDAVVSVSRSLAQNKNGSEDLEVLSDLDFLFHEGQLQIGRYYPEAFEDLYQRHTVSQERACLKIETPGVLSGLQWVEIEERTLEPQEVEIEVRSIGMNYKDVLIAMGIVPANRNELGLEGAGIIRKKGSRVSDLEVGDRVMFLGSGTFATHAQTHQELCVKIPAELDFEAAATMPCVYATVIQALLRVGCLQKGQTVLIHSACGGVGIAAIQVCQMIGGDIYTTVGSDKKAQYLQQHFKIPPNHIFNSRTDSFLSDVHRETAGRGVDLVLNSLSGELLHASWKCVASFGKMVEIGKRDLLGKGSLALDIFEENRTFAAVDLTTICSMRPQQAKSLLEQTMAFYNNGSIHTIPIAQKFQASDVQDCFRYMQRSEHIGKIVVSIPADQSELQARRRISELRFKPNASYLLVGGFGSLGKSIATWMVERGARSLIILSPSAGLKTSDHRFKAELEAMDCTVQAYAGRVEDVSDVEKALQQAHLPLAGILQLSMVLRDRPFDQMTFQEWQEATACKVQGTWNLHNQTIAAGIDLDFFVLFASISGIVGNRKQANYAAANTFLDAFVPFRRSLGLPCSAIDVGLMEDVGAARDVASLTSTLKAYGNHPLQEQQLLDVLQIAFTDQYGRHTAPQTASHPVLGIRSATPLSSPDNRVIWKRDARFSYYHQPSLYDSSSAAKHAQSFGDGQSILGDIVHSAVDDPSILDHPSTHTKISKQLALKLLDLLLKTDSTVSEDRYKDLFLTDLGLDSLVAIEVRAWWERTFRFQISMLSLLEIETVGELATKAIVGLKERT